MNAEQLADRLDKPLGAPLFADAAAMLRKQDAAIRQLREALRHMITVCPAIDPNGEEAHEHAFNAMAATENL